MVVSTSLTTVDQTCKADGQVGLLHQGKLGGVQECMKSSQGVPARVQGRRVEAGEGHGGMAAQARLQGHG